MGRGSGSVGQEEGGRGMGAKHNEVRRGPFGAELRRVRRQADRTAEQVAAELGMTVPGYTFYEKTDLPSAETLDRIVRAVGVPGEFPRLWRMVLEAKGSVRVNTAGLPDTALDVLAVLTGGRVSPKMWADVRDVLARPIARRPGNPV